MNSPAKHFLIPVLLVGLHAVTTVFAQSPQIEEKIDSLLAKMTLVEKVGQLTQYSGMKYVSEEMIREGKVGSFLNVRGAEAVNRLQKIATEESRLGIPLIFGNDVIHGYRTTFPIPLGAAASWNPGLVEKAARIAAVEAAAAGTHWTFAPMVDIARDPRWGRIAEGAGEDPYLGSMMAAAQVSGFQGSDLSDPLTIAACAKHYVGYGAAEGGRDYNTVDMSERLLREVYLPPYQASVKAGVATLMSAFNDLSGVPASANRFTLTHVLRDEWDFDGFVVSDYNAIGELVNHGIAADKKEAALRAISAGVDMDMVGDTLAGGSYPAALAELVTKKLLSDSLLDVSVHRVLRIKYRLGLFKHPYVDTVFYKDYMFARAYRDSIARQLARESMVLLKNEHNLLPLGRNLKSIAVIGPLANNRHDLAGPWSAEERDEEMIPVLKGIREAVSPGTKIEFAVGCEIKGNDKGNFGEAIRLAERSDAVVLVLGESKEMSGEAASRTCLNLPGVQEDLAEEINKTGTPLVIVLMNGRPLTISRIAAQVPAILEAWFPGNQAGNAIADVLFGKYNPSGKLPVTFPRNAGQIPVYYNHLNTGRPPSDEKYTSRYIDSPVSPLYPFGYGLSYTTFNYSNLNIEPPVAKIGDTIRISVKVKNEGSISGAEVVQLYIRDRLASISRPVMALRRFEKIDLAPGEMKTVAFEITTEDLSFYGVDMKKIVEPGMFDIMTGGNTTALLTTSFKLVEK